MQAKRAVEVAHENRDSIIGRWLAMVEADTELASIDVSKNQRQGHPILRDDWFDVRFRCRFLRVTYDAAPWVGTNRRVNALGHHEL
jgi:hypothetical protein